MFAETDETLASRNWKRSTSILRDDAIYTVRYDPIGRYRFPSEWSDGDCCFRHRKFGAAIFRGDRYIGFIKFECYKIAYEQFSPTAFVDQMDAIGADELELATAFAGSWPAEELDEIISLGFVLEFHRAWVRPEYRPCFVWVDAAEHLIQTVFRQHSIMLMMAAPMELQHADPFRSLPRDPTPAQKEQQDLYHQQKERYRENMIRAYKRLLGVDSLPGRWGEEGWLWRPRPSLRDVIDQPSCSRLIDPYEDDDED